MGAGALYGLRTAAGGTLVSWAAWARPPSTGSATQRAGRWSDAQWDYAEVTIDRSEQARARLPLEVTGAEAGPVEVALQGLPAGVRPSHGELRGPSTWVLKQPELTDLHLALDPSAPQVFNVKVAVLAPAGVATVGSIVHVRVVDATAPAQAVASDGDSLRSAPAQASPPAQASVTPGADRPVGPPARRRAAAAGVTEVAPTSSPRPWPEGASGLGAVAREAERQTWWEVPPPSWSPFQDGQATP
jgi:hypothetical protein